MPTDTTIIDRLRGLAEMMGTDGDAEAEASAIVLAAADALTAAHAARDAAEQSSHEDTARYIQHMARADAASREARDLRAQLTTALRERDEARGTITSLRVELAELHGDLIALMRAQQEEGLKENS